MQNGRGSRERGAVGYNERKAEYGTDTNRRGRWRRGRSCNGDMKGMAEEWSDLRENKRGDDMSGRDHVRLRSRGVSVR